MRRDDQPEPERLQKTEGLGSGRGRSLPEETIRPAMDCAEILYDQEQNRLVVLVLVDGRERELAAGSWDEARGWLAEHGFEPEDPESTTFRRRPASAPRSCLDDRASGP